MRHEKRIERNDGTVVRLVAVYMPNLFGPDAIDNFALVQRKGADDWELYTPDRSSDKSLGGLSVDEYVKYGRKGLLCVVRPHEIIKVNIELNERLRAA